MCHEGHLRSLSSFGPSKFNCDNRDRQLVNSAREIGRNGYESGKTDFQHIFPWGKSSLGNFPWGTFPGEIDHFLTWQRASRRASVDVPDVGRRPSRPLPSALDILGNFAKFPRKRIFEIEENLNLALIPLIN